MGIIVGFVTWSVLKLINFLHAWDTTAVDH
jgi:hypothetical protein